MDRFPSLKARRLLRILTTDVGYSVRRQTGSHRFLTHPNRPSIIFAYHDKRTVPPHIVRTMLVQRAGLEEQEARDLL